MASRKKTGVSTGAELAKNGTNGRARQGRVTLIPGDGVGPEVTGAAVRVVEAAGIRVDWDLQEGGATALKSQGSPIPEALINSLRRTRVALKGPLETQVGHGYRSINVYLRKAFNLYANLRPTAEFRGSARPLPQRRPGGGSREHRRSLRGD
jgi:isocitrate/isopropylmalate dehydrogenase